MAKCKITISVLFFFLLVATLTNVLYIDAAYAEPPILTSITLSDLDSGSTDYTNSPTVNVTIVCSGSPTEMIFSQYQDFNDTDWISYENPTTCILTMPPYSPYKTLYCKLRNASLEESNVVSNTIYLDTQAPHVNEVLSQVLNTTHIDISFAEPVIDGENPLNYEITNGASVLAVGECQSSYYYYRYRLVTTAQIPGIEYTVTASESIQDLSGNYINPSSRTYTCTAVSNTDTTSPQVEDFSIENDTSYTNALDVDIAMTESDESGIVVKWLITDHWIPPPQTPPSEDFILSERPTTYTLSEGDGIKALYGWVMDDSGNISSWWPGKTSDSIILDQTSPTADAGQDQTVELATQVTLDGSLSTDNYEIAEYLWGFGDESQGSGVIVTHTYAAAGIYTAILTVYDAAGNDPSTDEVIITVEESGIPSYLEVGGPDPDYNTITDAMTAAGNGITIHVYPGIYNESVHMKEGVLLEGDNASTTIIRGSVFFEEVNAALDNFTILFREGSILSFSNDYYTAWNLVADAGITAVNSQPIVKNCIIKPDLDTINTESSYDPPLEHYGKAIQIWNMYNTAETSPQIEFNLIQNTDCGIYYFSQAFGGAINGDIKNNTFYDNKTGILLRMHKENPRIYNNIFDNCQGPAIFLVYEDGGLFANRQANMNNNLYNQNTQNFWLDSSGSSFDLIGIQENIEDDPLFINPENDNFHLEPGSPAVTGGEGDSLMGAYGEPLYELFIEITSHIDGETIYSEP